MTLNKAAKQLGIYDSEQKSFFQNVSHELRTPLMSIKCYAEGISVGLMEPKSASNTILQETDRLTEMVSDLLYISKVDNVTSTYKKTKVDLSIIIRRCAEQQSIIAEAKQLRLSFNSLESDVYFDCVEELIIRAVNNLISNAIRYASSEIILSCHKKNNQIIIRVSDDGPGIETENLLRIFERFYKGSGGNHGIGLSLVKSIVEQHNGNVRAENSKKGGAVFTIVLPLPGER
jgi:signal transduction histidine kinase